LDRSSKKFQTVAASGGRLRQSREARRRPVVVVVVAHKIEPLHANKSEQNEELRDQNQIDVRSGAWAWHVSRHLSLYSADGFLK